MQTQNQKYVKWIPKKDTYVQKVFKKNKEDEVFIPKEAKKKFEIIEEAKENKNDKIVEEEKK